MMFSFLDHNVIFVPYLADNESETLDALFRGEQDEVDSKRHSIIHINDVDTLQTVHRMCRFMDKGRQRAHGAQVRISIAPSSYH